jgi:membrane-bound metal-dependent hydrolase YbcI (DUF457 family)
MPLALGHMAVGLLTESAIEKPETTTRKRLILLFLLVNSPDIDIVISWLATGNLYTYHRTFTHSILFAVIEAALFSNLSRLFHSFPKLSYKWCYWAVISHVLADYLFSPWETAFLWPLPIQPKLFNDLLDHVGRYAHLEREIEVILICLVIYLLAKSLGAAVNYLHRLLLPA